MKRVLTLIRSFSIVVLFLICLGTPIYFGQKYSGFAGVVGGAILGVVLYLNLSTFFRALRLRKRGGRAEIVEDLCARMSEKLTGTQPKRFVIMIPHRENLKEIEQKIRSSQAFVGITVHEVETIFLLFSVVTYVVWRRRLLKVIVSRA